MLRHRFSSSLRTLCGLERLLLDVVCARISQPLARKLDRPRLHEPRIALHLESDFHTPALPSCRRNALVAIDGDGRQSRGQLRRRAAPISFGFPATRSPLVSRRFSRACAYLRLRTPSLSRCGRLRRLAFDIVTLTRARIHIGVEPMHAPETRVHILKELRLADGACLHCHRSSFPSRERRAFLLSAIRTANPSHRPPQPKRLPGQIAREPPLHVCISLSAKGPRPSPRRQRSHPATERRCPADAACQRYAHRGTAKERGSVSRKADETAVRAGDRATSLLGRRGPLRTLKRYHHARHAAYLHARHHRPLACSPFLHKRCCPRRRALVS